MRATPQTGEVDLRQLNQQRQFADMNQNNT